MIRGRYAPSPTGTLHLGNASTALLAWLSIRSRGGRFVLRMEDLDRPRVVAGARERIMEDLRWLGLDWDEGPVDQSGRLGHYDAAFDRLLRDGYVYPCFCSRRDIAAAASAPQVPGDELAYPGTCRDLTEADASARMAAGASHAFRFRVDAAALEPFDDLVRGRVVPDAGSIGDFVVRRADGVPAYQLAVVVDDIAMGIGEVVRGGDLLGSTPRQILLYRALGASLPAFAHVPLLLGEDGVRLSKRHRGVTLAELRGAGASPSQVVGTIAGLLGLAPPGREIEASSLVSGFSLASIAGGPAQITLAG